MNKRKHLSLLIDYVAIDFSEGFNNLHTAFYEGIFRGGGIDLEERKEVISFLSEISVKLIAPS